MIAVDIGNLPRICHIRIPARKQNNKIVFPFAVHGLRQVLRKQFCIYKTRSMTDCAFRIDRLPVNSLQASLGQEHNIIAKIASKTNATFSWQTVIPNIGFRNNILLRLPRLIERYNAVLYGIAFHYNEVISVMHHCLDRLVRYTAVEPVENTKIGRIDISCIVSVCIEYRVWQFRIACKEYSIVKYIKESATVNGTRHGNRMAPRERRIFSNGIERRGYNPIFNGQ